MNFGEALAFLVGALVLGAGFFFGGYFWRKIVAERLIRTAESKAREILTIAKREAEELERHSEKEAKSYLAKVQKDFEDKIGDRRRELEGSEKSLGQKEKTIDQKLDLVEKREKETAFKLQEAALKEKDILEQEKALQRMIAEEKIVLQKISGLNADEAKTQFLRRLELDARAEAGKLLKSVESESKSIADEKAKKILSLAMQRLAAAHTIENTVTVVHLPSEEMKGRIIGKDGKNIRTFETLTGVDLVIDETPQVVTLSSFDAFRREIARMAMDELVTDGRIQPARIEDVVQKAKRNMEEVLKQEGERALAETKLQNVHPEIVKLLGRMKFRSSYGQNVLDHSIEVAWIMNAIAGEMGIDPVLARRAGLFHDLGKAVSHDIEGPHALIGGELARRFGEHPDVVHAIEAHHEDIPMQSMWPMLTQAADAVSAARPGARRESLDNYLKRLNALEKVADEIPGVEKAYAIQGGHEIRVVVKPERVSEESLPALAREITKKIEDNLTYPGQIKVILIRETRIEDIAK